MTLVQRFAAGAVVGFLVGLFFAWIGVPWWLVVMNEVSWTLATMVWLGLLQERRQRRRQQTITPAMVDMPDPVQRHVIAQAFNTGKSVFGYYDVDGKMRIVEREPVRVPIVRVDKDGTTIDATARVRAMLSDLGNTGSVGVEAYDVRDLDGNELELPPGSRFEFDINMRDVFGV